MVYCSDNRTQNNAQTKQSKMELYTLNLGHISSHFYQHDKLLKKILIFPQHKKNSCVNKSNRYVFLDHI